MLPTLQFILFVLLLVGCVNAQSSLTQDKKRSCPGASAKAGDKIHVHYSGYIDKSSAAGKPDKMFDSSHKRGKPFVFKLGAGQVIRGWDQGIEGMCLGEKKELVIPPELGYGDRGAGKDIPPGATLRFEVDIVGINDQVLKVEPTPNIFKEMDTNGDGVISYEEMAAWFANRHPDKLDRIPAGLFEREDKNADGVISWEEFQGPKGHEDHSEL